jgi:DNA-binding MarR family transcriptional regulator
MKRPSLPVLPCACASLRRATRAISGLYEDALRPSGLRNSQFTILQALSLAGEMNQGRLGEILAMDSTTLTRTLRILERQGWLTKRRGKDRRAVWLNLTKNGISKFRSALPLWQDAQARTQKLLGARRWKELTGWSDHLTATITQGGSTL